MEFNVFFRALKSEDAIFINNLRKNSVTEDKLVGFKRFVALEREQKWVSELILNDNPSLIYVAVCEKGSEDIIGYASISDIDYRNGTCQWSGLKLLPEKSGNGYGLQVALLIIKYSFEELRMVRVWGVVVEDHEVQLKLINSAGYQKEGLMRKHIYKNGEYKNNWLVSIIIDDYAALKKKYKL